MNEIIFIVDNDFNFDFSALGSDSIFIRLKIDDIVSRRQFTVSEERARDALKSAFVAGVILSAKNQDKVQQVFENLNKLLPHFTCKMVSAFDIDPVGIASWVARSAISFSKLIALQAARAERENAEIRILYSRVQSALSEVESFHDAPYRSRILFQVLPGKHSVKISTAPISVEIAAEYSSLHAIDIFFDNQPHVLSAADIEVRLIGASSGRQLALWRIQEAKLQEGWNRFYCPIMDEPIGEAIAVTLRSTKEKTQFALRAGIDTEWQANSAPSDRNSIALRLWSGLVGMKLPKSSPGHFVDEEEQTVPLTLARSELLQLATPLDANKAKLVFWDERRDGLMVHPKGVDPVIAHIQTLQAVDLSTVRVHCKLVHPEAAVTDFAIWIVRSDEQASVRPLVSPERNSVGRLLSGLRKSFIGSSGIPSNLNWLTLSGDQEGEVSFTLDPPYTGSIELFLATRNKSKANQNAWALFTDIHFGSHSS
ncbi:putative membrane-anchored protein [Rhizobium freirei PRF 81]|uniref:Putative membrane-anchored protein n=1 Tax=Rhizobium freirei PRF 81 TaxID=363754 RepID=N6UVD8_9HYPH|nr:DUF6212 domain-containing protein [Rhizobium freirei]ENN85620.1 putative membrane-anchored protein [Rhizobium freirei PRF 81]